MVCRSRVISINIDRSKLIMVNPIGIATCTSDVTIVSAESRPYRTSDIAIGILETDRPRRKITDPIITDKINSTSHSTERDSARNSRGRLGRRPIF